MATNKDLRERIKRLEDALSFHELPYSDQTCQCCGEIYVPLNYDSARCDACVYFCHKEGKDWIRGRHCPKNRKKL